MPYHPNYFDKYDLAVRSSCRMRLALLQEYIKGGSLLDYGCSGGYFSFGFMGICNPVLAIDNQKHLINECKRTNEKHSADSGIEFKCEDIGIVNDLGEFDNCLYMSTHHHVIAKYGYGPAKHFLWRLSKKCTVMFFDMGQKNEDCKQHKWWQLLPDVKKRDQEKWLVEYLRENTVYERIEKVGLSVVHGIQRILFKMGEGRVTTDYTDCTEKK